MLGHRVLTPGGYEPVLTLSLPREDPSHFPVSKKRFPFHLGPFPSKQPLRMTWLKCPSLLSDQCPVRMGQDVGQSRNREPCSQTTVLWREITLHKLSYVGTEKVGQA